MNTIKHLLLLLCVLYSSTAMAQKLTLNNGVIKLQVDLQSGGAISYLSAASNSYNVVNVHDKGRYIQQSYYNGHRINRTAQGQHPQYSPWEWNPIQAGDVYGNNAQIISSSSSGNQLYVKTRPKLWDMNNELCQCYFETWVTLEGTAAKVRNKLTTFQTDNLWTPIPKHQEMPAVYTRGDLYKLYSYRGSSPWTQGGLSRITNPPPVNGNPVWEYWGTSERWAALVNSNNWGVGVYNANSTTFLGGLSGSPGGGPTGNSTGYFAPYRTIQLSKNGTFEFEYYLILGDLTTIRNWVYNKRGISTGGGSVSNSINFEFNSGGNVEGWTRAGGANSISQTGGTLRVSSTSADPQIIRNISFNPRLYDFLKIRMRNTTNNSDMDLFWANAAGGFSGSRRVRVTVVPNSNYREYTFDLRNVSAWKNGGTITAIRIDPPGDGNSSGEYVNMDYIRFSGTGTTKQAASSSEDQSVNVFPNPFTNELNIRTSEEQIEVFNLQGERLNLPLTKTGSGFHINSEMLAPGLYLLKIGSKVFKIKKI